MPIINNCEFVTLCSKIKKGERVKAVFKRSEDREGKMTDFFFVPEDEYETWISKPEYEGGA